MELSTFMPEASPARPNNEPWLKISDRDGGCGHQDCNCSPGFWISLSDGKKGYLINCESRDEFTFFVSEMLWALIRQGEWNNLLQEKLDAYLGARLDLDFDNDILEKIIEHYKPPR